MAAALFAVCCLAAVPSGTSAAYGAVRATEASGTVTYGNSKVKIDASHTNDGYLMVKYSGRNSRIKVQITHDATYTYDLNARDAYEVFPLTEGDGSYSIKVFENISGNQYAQAFSQSIQVALSDPNLPFLYPNQYVNFHAGSNAVAVSSQLSEGAADQLGIVTNVFNFVVDNLTYDYEKAATVQSGYLPDVDVTLETKKGICFDYASLMTAMLRAQDIPTKLVIGYTGDLYHAWISVYLENQGWVDNIIYFDGQNWSMMDPTFASSGGKSYGAGNETYRAKYSY